MKSIIYKEKQKIKFKSFLENTCISLFGKYFRFFSIMDSFIFFINLKKKIKFKVKCAHKYFPATYSFILSPFGESWGKKRNYFPNNPINKLWKLCKYTRNVFKN